MHTITSSTLLHCRLSVRSAAKLRDHRRTVVSASIRRDSYGGGGELVDENMIMLRKRIHETKMAERKYEPPTEWKEWEKQYYTTYNSDIYKVVGVLQMFLMSTRPSVAVGILAILLFSVPTSLNFISSVFLQAMAYYMLPGSILF